MSKSWGIPLLALAALLSPCAALCQPTPVEQFLGTFSGAAAVPPNVSPGSGPVEANLDALARSLQVDLSYSDLMAAASLAHIHCCAPPGSSIGVAVPFPLFPGGVSSGTYQDTFDLSSVSVYASGFITANGGTAAGAEAALIAGLRMGHAYFDIHTTMFPGGEVRAYTVSIVFLDSFDSGGTGEWDFVVGEN